jgi:hypothetical protein
VSKEGPHEKNEGVWKKNPSSFFQCREKLGGFFFYKVKFTWRKARATRKDEKEEKMEEWL